MRLALIGFSIAILSPFAHAEGNLLSIKDFAPYDADIQSPLDLALLETGGKETSPKSWITLDGNDSRSEQQLELSYKLKTSSSSMEFEQHRCSVALFQTQRQLNDGQKIVRKSDFVGSCAATSKDETIKLVWPVQNRLLVNSAGSHWFRLPGVVVPNLTTTAVPSQLRYDDPRSVFFRTATAIPSTMDAKAGNKVCKALGYKGINIDRSRRIEPLADHKDVTNNQSYYYVRWLYAGHGLRTYIDQNEPNKEGCGWTWFSRACPRVGTSANLVPISPKSSQLSATVVSVNERGDFVLARSSSILGLLVCDLQ
jgi:hypothetical protein